MGDVGRGRRSRPRRWRRRCAWRPRISPRLPRLRGEAEAGVRGQLMSTSPTLLAWPFFDERHRGFAERAVALGPTRSLPALAASTTSTAPAARACGARARPASRAAVPRRLWRSAPRSSTCARSASRARSSACSRRARRFRLRHAGARHRLDHRCSARRTEGALAAAGARRQGDRRLRAVGARGRLGRRGAWRRPPTPTAMRMCASTATRPGSRTAASPTITWCSPAPARRRARKGLSAFVVDADTPGLTRRRAHRGDRAASARDLALRRRAACRSPTGSASPARASRWRWRRSTSSARRSAPRRSASRAARCTRRSSAPRRASCSARRSPTCS